MASIFGGSNSAQQNPNGLTTPLADLTVSSSANGESIPIGYGVVPVGANIIWSPGLVEHTTTVTVSSKGGPTTTSTQYLYTVSFAAAFGEGPGTIMKIEGDSQVLYDEGATSTAFYTGDWSEWATYVVGDIVHDGTAFFICYRVPPVPGPNPIGSLGLFLFGSSYWDLYTKPVQTGGAQQYPSPTIYAGDYAQMPDPTIQAQIGVGMTPAYRGLVYAVWDNLPVTNFGNRVPSIRGVVAFGSPSGSPPTAGLANVDAIVTDLCVRAGIPASVLDVSDLTPLDAEEIAQPPNIPDGIALASGTVCTFYQGWGGSPFGFYYPGDGPDEASHMTPKFTYPLNFNGASGSGPGIALNPTPQSFLPGYQNAGAWGIKPFDIAGINGDGQWDGTGVAPWRPGNVGNYKEANWQMIWDGQFYVTEPGTYTFKLAHNDGVIVGIGNGATRVSGPMIDACSLGTHHKTAKRGYPVMMMANGEDDNATGSGFGPLTGMPNNPPETFEVNFPVGNTYYPFEIDHATHTGHCITLSLDWIVPSFVPTYAEGTQLPIIPFATPGAADSMVPCFGYIVTSQTDAASMIKQLEDVYKFDSCESDFMLKWIRRGVHPAVLVIPESDLGLEADKAELTETITQEQDLPQNVEIDYLDPSIDYQKGKQNMWLSSRACTTVQQVSLDLPIVLTQSLARQLAYKTLALAWAERQPYKFNLWKAFYALLDPTDVVDFVYENEIFEQRILNSTIGQNFAVEMEGVSHTDGSYKSVVTGGVPGYLPPPTYIGGETIVFMYDIPYLQDSDASLDRLATGFYWDLCSPAQPWSGGVLLQSPDGSTYSQLGGSASKTAYGYANGALPDAPIFGTWDTTSTLSVTMVNGTLASVTDEEVCNGANVMLVGNELIQFANVEQTDTNTYTISRLLRGRRNTEPFATGHAGLEGSPPVGEACVVPGAGMQRSTFEDSFIGKTEDYKAVANGGDPTAVEAQTFCDEGHDLMPAAPCQLTGTRDGSNNLTIDWYRRTRYGGNGLVGPTPLNEDTEAYSIDIKSGSSVVRTITSTSPTAAYSAANQTTDGLTPGNPVSVVIYQLSAQVGRGFPAAAVI